MIDKLSGLVPVLVCVLVMQVSLMAADTFLQDAKAKLAEWQKTAYEPDIHDVESLLVGMHDEAYIALLNHIGKQRMTGMAQVATGALGSDDVPLILAGLRAVTGTGCADWEQLDLVRELLRSLDTKVLHAAITVIKLWNDDASTIALLRLCKFEDGKVRSQAEQALRSISHYKRPNLDEFLDWHRKQDEEFDILVGHLDKNLSSGSDPQEAKTAVDQLVVFPAHEHLLADALRDLMEHEDKSVREYVRHTLERKQTPEARLLLQEFAPPKAAQSLAAVLPTPADSNEALVIVGALIFVLLVGLYVGWRMYREGHRKLSDRTRIYRRNHKRIEYTGD